MTLRSFADGAVFGDDLSAGTVDVVGLHGWGRDRRDLAAALAGRAALLVDLPGFGSSPPPATVWGARDYARLVAELLDDLDSPAVVVVGHSFGGKVAVCLAAARPDLVRGLVLCGVPLLRPGAPARPALGYRVVRRLHRWGVISDRQMEQRRRASGSADYRAATGVMRDVLVTSVNESYEDELRQLACPVAFLWGADDTAAPAAVAHRAAELVAQPVEVAVLDGVGHDVHLARPEEVGRLVDAVAAAAQGRVTLAVGVIGLVAGVAATLRWLRVMQREHYLPGSALTIARLWVQRRPPNRWLLPAGIMAAVVAAAGRPRPVAVGLAVVASAVAAAFPLGMPLLGRGVRLKATRRLRTLAGLVLVLGLALAAAGALVGAGGTAVALLAVAVPLLVDAAAWVAQPLERRLADRHRRRAEEVLTRVAPRTIAVTGSFGKTSTKNHIRTLVGDALPTVASPASWNNMAGLSRAVNEHLHPGVEVFVAEMGTYGPGEIRAMCAWVHPEIAVITAIGPAHLERMGSLDNIARAKSEILEGARVAILNVDDRRLAAIADQAANPEVWRVGTGGQPGLDVAVTTGPDGVAAVEWRGTPVGSFVRPPGVHAGNVACAVAAVLAIGLTPAQVAPRLDQLAPPDHRASTVENDNGLLVIDDTFNSNPSGARAALGRLVEPGPGGRSVVVTPGMVELGHEQDAENEAFARAVAEAGAHLVVVGWTNRRALVAGAGGQVTTVADRDAAREWVRANLGPGDRVLWENDLPDQYP